MSDKVTASSIADSSKPNAGRIYDYLLGGNHNFEVDRMAADRLKTMAPFMPKLFRLIRWFLGEAVQRLSAEGFTSFLDFASGLPTVDHIHQTVPKGTRVIYSDIDPVTVSYGKEIIKDVPDTVYMLCDAGTPEALLASEAVSRLFGSNRKVAIGFNGITWFLPDDRIAHAMRILHDWAAPGTKLFVSTEDAAEERPESNAIRAIYEKLGQPLFPRPKEKLAEIARPWRLVEPGFRLLEDWIDVKRMVSDEAKGRWGGAFYGAFLVK